MAGLKQKGKSQLIGTANVPCKQNFRKYQGEEYENFTGTLTVGDKNIVLTIQVDKKSGSITTTSVDKKSNAEIPTIWIKAAVFPSNYNNQGGGYRR